MDGATSVFLGLVTFAAALNVVKGTIRVLAETHPDSTFLTAWDELTS